MKKKIDAVDYAFFRSAHGRSGLYDEVRAFIAQQDILRDEAEAEEAAERQERIEEMRQRIAANWKRFDMMPGYFQNKGE